MNNIQKIFVLVGISGLLLFIVSITLLEWSLSEPFINTIFNRRNTRAPFIENINWLGLVGVLNMIISFVGFFLFKNK